MNDLNRFVPDVRFEKIPIKNLVSNQKYQRNAGSCRNAEYYRRASYFIVEKRLFMKKLYNYNAENREYRKNDRKQGGFLGGLVECLTI